MWDSDLKFDFTFSRLRMRFSFESEGPKPAKAPFKHVYLNIKMACQNICTLEYGPPEILKYGPVRITHEKKAVHFTQIWVIWTTFTKLAAQTPHILNQFLLQKGSLVQDLGWCTSLFCNGTLIQKVALPLYRSKEA